MMNTSTVELFAALEQTAQTLRDCLHEERRALLARDPEQIAHLAAHKFTLLGKVQQGVAQLADGKMQTAPSEPVGWRRCMELLNECRAMNEANGALIGMSANHARRSLQSRRGETGPAARYDAQSPLRDTASADTLGRARVSRNRANG